MPVVTKADSGTVAAVQAVADKEFHAMAAGDTAAFLRLLTRDVVFFPPNTPPKAGPAVEPWIGEFLRQYSVEFQEHHHDDVLVAAEWALLRTSFRWRVASCAGGEASVRLGHTVRVFRNESGQGWLLAREIWTTYPAT